eukprot:143880_1
MHNYTKPNATIDINDLVAKLLGSDNNNAMNNHNHNTNSNSRSDPNFPTTVPHALVNINSVMNVQSPTIQLQNTNAMPFALDANPVLQTRPTHTFPSTLRLNQLNVGAVKDHTVSIKLSDLNDLVHRVKTYEALFAQLLAQNPPHMLSPSTLRPYGQTTMFNINNTATNVPNPFQGVAPNPTEKQMTDAVFNECPKTESAASDYSIYKKKIPNEHGVNANARNKNKSAPKHIKDGEYYVCKTCGKRYLYLCNLRSHSKVHTDAAHICEFCNKKFGRRANYEEHKRIHTGELPYKCNICERKFRQRHGWKDHHKIHHQNK